MNRSVVRSVVVFVSAAAALGAARLGAAVCGFGNSNNWCIAQGDKNPTSEGPEALDHFGETLAFGDFNADGLEDLAIGTPDEDFVGLNAGQVDVYDSRGLTFDLIQSTFRQNGTTGADGGSENDDRMGGTLAVGDFDGDGFDDLAVASPSEDQTLTPGDGCGEFGLCDDIGLVQILWGGDNGLLPNQVTVIDFIAGGFGGSEPTAFPLELGACLAAGDLDQDGIDDLAIGGPGSDFGASGSGGISLMIGSADRLIDNLNLTVTRPSEESFDHLGKACAIGRFANLGSINFLDRSVVGGCPGCTVGGSNDAGTLIELSGTTSEVAQTDFGTAGNGSNDAFGSVFATGDFDDDGFDDLAIGVPQKNDGGVTDSGRVYVAFGGSAGLLAGGFRIFGLDSFPGVSLEEDAAFGSALAAGDLDGDGIDDLAIGAPNNGFDDRGFVYVAYGKRNTTLLEIRSAFVISAPSIGGTFQANAHFGAALAIGDTNGDGAGELAIAAPEENAGATDSGRVYLTHIFDPHWIFADSFESEGVAVWSDHTP